jgi:hypothetical protein
MNNLRSVLLWRQWEDYADQQHLIHRYNHIRIHRSYPPCQAHGCFNILRSRTADTARIAQRPGTG